MLKSNKKVFNLTARRGLQNELVLLIQLDDFVLDVSKIAQLSELLSVIMGYYTFRHVYYFQAVDSF